VTYDDLIFKVARTAEVQTLDLAWVERMRKDFLVLMKNVPRVKDYKTAMELDGAFRIFRDRFKNLFFEQFLNKQLKYYHDNFNLSESDAKYIDSRKLRTPAWDFYTDLANYPISRSDDYFTEGMRYSDYERALPKWEARMKRNAQAFWKVMREIVEWIEQVRKSKLDIYVPSEEKVTLDGFKLIFKGYQDEDETHGDIVERLKAGLKIYKQHAAARLPLWLKVQRPLLVEFETTLDKGGEYMSKDGGIIWLYSSGVMRESPGRIAHVIAHEMGHHVWRTYLSGEDIKFWQTAISGNYTHLDLKELLDKWPGDAWAFDMKKHLDDPILALQVEALTHDRSVGDKYQTKEDFQKLYDSGTKTLNVPAIPISGYANKNPEEAFCEAVGLLVGYGPQAVHEVVRGWLGTILDGQIKTATSENTLLLRVAANHMKSAGYFEPGQIVLYGKYKNKRGKIVSIGLDHRGVPTVTIEPVPKGRKKNIEMGLFKIWHDDTEARKLFSP
jgi:hypothetical protein